MQAVGHFKHLDDGRGRGREREREQWDCRRNHANALITVSGTCLQGPIARLAGHAKYDKPDTLNEGRCSSSESNSPNSNSEAAKPYQADAPSPKCYARSNSRVWTDPSVPFSPRGGGNQSAPISEVQFTRRGWPVSEYV